jgi:hypothetical protein
MKYVEKITTRVMFKNVSKNRAVFKIMWKNIVKPGRPQMTIWNMHVECWITDSKNTHSEYVAIPLQQLLHEGASILRHTYIACLV